MKDLSIISARRSYEFSQDSIRLTLLSNQPVVAYIKQMLHFEVGSIETPMETFGPLANTLPPGLVFDYGVSPVPEGIGTPIRYIHVEQRRIVIDVAGPSSALDDTFAQLREGLAELKTPEGYPAIGEPVNVRNFSEIRVSMEIEPRQFVPPALFELAEKQLPKGRPNLSVVPVLMLRMTPEGEYQGGSVPPIDIYTLDVRAGTSVDEGIYYSAGPLESDEHIQFLEQIEEALRQ